MKSSNNYLFYPPHRPLDRAITESMGMLHRDTVDASNPHNKTAAADNFLYTRGNFEPFRVSSHILESVHRALEASLTEEYRKNEPLAWAKTQNNLGNILAARAQQLNETELLEKAIQCFNTALETFNRETSPLDWAATQYNLGTAKQALGRQRDDSKSLKASMDAYTDALLVWSKEKTPFEWASTMHQLGATMFTYGKLLKGNRTLQKSVVAYKNALAVLDADNYALELAATHNNRGAVLHYLGESEENTDRLEEAIRSYETALTVCLEQQLPIHLAVLCRVNRSTARRALAELANDRTLANDVADEFELILECFPHALQPLCLKYCEEQINKAKCANVCA